MKNKKIIEIEIPRNKCAEWVNGVLTLVDEPQDEPQDVTERIKTFEDACEEDDRDPNFLPEQYHVKKEPSRPFHNAEECLNEMVKHQPFGWVYDKNNNQFLNTNRVGNDGVDFYGRQRNTFAKANSYITFADKEPFGIKE